MRIRSIKPEFYRSADIAALDWEARFLFIALWSYVDDNGVGIDKVSHIAADLFADDLEREPTETIARVTRGLQALENAGRIERYFDSGRSYIFVNGWHHQRIDKPNKARYPLPKKARNDADSTPELFEIAEPSREVRETPAPGTEEQRNRGTEDKKKPRPVIGPDEFIDWYLLYPRKEGRGQAERAYIKARQFATAEQLEAGVRRYASDPNREQQYTKLPATWLNGKCWDDDPLPPKKSTNPAAFAGRGPVQEWD